ANRKEAAAAYLAQAALRDAIVGNTVQAKTQTDEALKIYRNQYIDGVSGIVFGLTGKPEEANKIADNLAGQYPSATSLQVHYIPMIRAATALQSGNAAKAIGDLGPSSPYELGSPKWMNFVRLYVVYLRGQAYLKAGQGDRAATEFQKILDH